MKTHPPLQESGEEGISVSDGENPVSQDDAGSDAANVLSRTRKSSAGVLKSSRESVRTVNERLKELDALPSLQNSTPDPESGVKRVDTMAPPPPLPTQPLEPVASTFVDRGAPIPTHYGMDRLAVLMRDPNWVLVYWELKGGILDRLRFDNSAEVIDNSRWVLQVRTPGEKNAYVVDIDLRVGQWYLKVAPGTRLNIDLGFMDQHGDFVRVLSANETATPRPGVSDVVDERWMIVRAELEKLLGVGTDALDIQDAAGPSSSTVPRLARSEQPRAIGLFSGTVVNRERTDN